MNAQRSGKRKTTLRVQICNGFSQTRKHVPNVSDKLRKIKVAFIWLAERAGMSSVGYVLATGWSTANIQEVIGTVTSLKSFKKMISLWRSSRKLKKQNTIFRDTCSTLNDMIIIKNPRSMPKICCRIFKAKWDSFMRLKIFLCKSSSFSTTRAWL